MDLLFTAAKDANGQPTEALCAGNVQDDDQKPEKESREDLLQLAIEVGADTRGTAQIWKDNADYYPFYRRMSDEKLQGPNVASGFLQGTPLDIELKGSQEAIEPSPIEAISRN